MRRPGVPAVAKRFPLETVRSVVHRRAEDAAAVVRGQAARLQAAEGKLAELERYRDEYRMQRGQVLTEGGPDEAALPTAARVADSSSRGQMSLTTRPYPERWRTEAST